MIISVLGGRIGDVNGAELRLYGSRTDDSAKGGDIDLLLILPNDELRSEISFQKADILASGKGEIGEQKIDLLVTTRSKINDSAFQTLAYNGSLQLKVW